MSRNDYLITNKIHSPEERREIARRAGIASGKARRERRSYRAIADAMLSARLPEGDLADELRSFGVKASDADVKAYTLLGLIKACAGGSCRAFDRLVALCGEQSLFAGSAGASAAGTGAGLGSGSGAGLGAGSAGGAASDSVADALARLDALLAGIDEQLVISNE